MLPRKAAGLLAFDNDIMPNSKKPESDFSAFLKEHKIVDFEHIDTITNLHDFEQYPSKVCNTFLNRLKRGHNYLYDINYLNTLPPHYKVAVQYAINVFESKEYDHVDSMNFVDFTFLDESFSNIGAADVESLYNDMLSIYNRVAGLEDKK